MISPSGRRKAPGASSGARTSRRPLPCSTCPVAFTAMIESANLFSTACSAVYHVSFSSSAITAVCAMPMRSAYILAAASVVDCRTPPCG